MADAGYIHGLRQQGEPRLRKRFPARSTTPKDAHFVDYLLWSLWSKS
jgi:hypothetical protein